MIYILVCFAVYLMWGWRCERERAELLHTRFKKDQKTISTVNYLWAREQARNTRLHNRLAAVRKAVNEPRHKGDCQ